MSHECRTCGVELTDENWYPAHHIHGYYICNACHREQQRRWRKANPDKKKASNTRCARKRGHQSFDENKECGMYLGVHIAERVLRHVFKRVEQMPNCNPGFDFICGGGYKIDVKSSCRRRMKHGADQWMFAIRENHIAEYFLCLAFDNRDDLKPEHIWLIPANEINDHKCVGISETALIKWDLYKLDVEKVVACCNMIKEDLIT